MLTALRALAIVATLVAAGVLLGALPAIRSADLALLDLQFALLARHAPLPAAESVAIVGVDEASLATLDAPLPLALAPLAEAIDAVASARPRAIGLDLILPDRSYPSLAGEGERALIAALLGARRVAPVVAGITARADGYVRPIAPALMAAAGEGGFALLPTDRDGRVRRFDDRLGEGGETVPTLVGEIARLAGIPLRRGRIQYALGTGYDYVPLRDVLQWAKSDSRDELERAFGGKVVLFGAVLPYEDRLPQPVPLARWDASHDAPGVLVHAQALRTLEADATIREATWAEALALLTLAAMLWFVPGWHRRAIALVAFAAAAGAASLLLLRHGIELPLGSALRVALVAVALRGALDAWNVRRERARLRAQFSGYVSPPVLRAILDGRLDDDARRGRRKLAFLFADIRGFVELSVQRSPESVLALLNRYFGAMTPVLHAHGATIDNFRGDGIMVIFGAPNRVEQPAHAAVEAARDMLAKLDGLNDELRAEGAPPLAIGISMAYSAAVVGNVGSSERFNYTALGDGANVAARLQDVAKTTGFPVVATAALVEAAGEASRWTPLGWFPIRGHTDVEVFGWRPSS